MFIFASRTNIIFNEHIICKSGKNSAPVIIGAYIIFYSYKIKSDNSYSCSRLIDNGKAINNYAAGTFNINSIIYYRIFLIDNYIFIFGFENNWGIFGTIGS